MENNQATDLQRPTRKDFQVHVVLAPNGSTVDPKEWVEVLGDTQGKERRALLKEHGWKETTTFNQEAFTAKRDEFRQQFKTAGAQKRKDLFAKVFEEASVEPTPRVESALRTLLPALDDSNERRMMKALVNVVVAVDGALKPAAPVRATRGRRGRKQAAPVEPQVVSEAHSEKVNEQHHEMVH